jgi:hypothetical protein
MDFASISAGMAAVQVGLDTAKAALGIIKDAKDMLPSSDQKQRIEAALAQANEKMAEGEAAVANALGYTLCRCQFPPTPMLLVGHIPIRHLSGVDMGQALSQKPKAGGGMTGSVPVHECPKCKTTDAPKLSEFPANSRLSSKN